MSGPVRGVEAPGERVVSPAEWVFQHAARKPRADALDAPGVVLSYGALAERVAVLAGDLAIRGATAGDRIVVALPPSPDAAIASLAVHALGACAVELDPSTPARALAAVLEQARPRFAIVHARDARAWSGAGGRTRLEWAWVAGPRLAAGALPARGTTALGPCGEPAVPARPIPAPRRVGASDPALVLFTASATRAALGVVLSYGNLEASARSTISFLGLTAVDRAMAILPFYYCHGRSVLHAHLLAGGSVLVEPRFRFPRLALEALRAEECTSLAGVPLTFELLRREVDVRDRPLPALRYVLQAGGRMEPATLAWARAAFAPARLVVVYGLAEATASLAFLPPERAGDREGALGIAVPGVELRVVDEAGHERKPGEVGHLVARGPTVTLGYLGAPEETSRILRDGWLWTGELSRRDGDGLLLDAGRARDVVEVSGLRLDPQEIEDALGTHDAVADAAVVGAPDALAGETAVAFVVLRRGAAATERDLRAFCRDALGRWKVPSRVVAIDAMPRSASGQLLRRPLRERATALVAAALVPAPP